MDKLTRRTFLNRSLQGATAVSALSAKSYARIYQANERIILGIVGLGGTGTMYSRLIAKQPKNLHVAGICDVDRRRFPIVKKQHGDAVEYTDFREMLDRRGNQLDALVIATPSHWNALTAIWSVQAGKALLLEAPATHTINEAEFLTNSILKSKAIVQVGIRHRSQERFLGLKNELEGLGKVSLVRTILNLPRLGLKEAPNKPVPEFLDYDKWLGPAPLRPYNDNRFQHWRWYWDYGSGFFGTHGLHFLDLACWMLDWTSVSNLRVSCGGGKFAKETPGDVPDTQIATYRLNTNQGEATFNLENRAWRRNSQSPYTLIFYGTKGVLVLDQFGYRTNEEENIERPQPPNRPAFSLSSLRNPEPHFQNFLECLRTRKRPNGDILSAGLSTKLSHLANIAYRTQQATNFKERELVYDFKANSFQQALANTFLSREYRRGYELPNMRG